MSKLPLANQTFREIREGGHLYVDKTEPIYNLINRLSYTLLNRPHGFGKSLLLSTFKELFSGNRQLFKGLWIDSSDFDFKKHPVVLLKMGELNSQNRDELEKGVIEQLGAIATEAEVDFDSESAGPAIQNLCRELEKKFGQRVVVLIDDYDKPIVDQIHNMNVAKSNWDFLYFFYGLFKELDEHLHFLMLAGTTRICITTCFSGLNNLSEISLYRAFADICGFPANDLGSLLADLLPEIMEYRQSKSLSQPDETKDTLQKEILSWYGGYSWNGKTRLINPFSLLKFCDEKIFKEFGVKSGTPTFLIDMINNNPLETTSPNPTTLSSYDLYSFEVDRHPFLALMFYTGYLTIDEIRYNNDDDDEYLMTIPNLEVMEALKLLLGTA